MELTDIFYSIDRIYKDVQIAVLIGDDESKLDIAVNLLPENAEVGHILSLENDSWVINCEETERRKINIETRFKKLFKNRTKEIEE